MLLWFDASGFLRLGLCAAFLHEWGHILVYWAMFRTFPTIEVTPDRLLYAHTGPQHDAAADVLAGRSRAADERSCWRLSGPSGWNRRPTIRGSAFWAANLLTGAFNLLPIPPLDGAQMGLALREALRQRNQGLQFPRKSGKIKRMKKRSVNGGT